MEEGLRGGGHGGERSQGRVEGGRRGRGRRRAGGEAVAEVAGGGRRGVGVLLQARGGVVAVGGAVVQVRGGGAELGLQHQAGLQEGLRVDVLLGEPAGGEVREGGIRRRIDHRSAEEQEVNQRPVVSSSRSNVNICWFTLIMN